MTVERRYVELRQEGGRLLSGRAVVYGDVARVPWGQERIEPGAFAPIGDVLLNDMHQRAVPLARTGGGGLELIDSAEALEVRATLPETRAANDVLELVKAGILRGLSVEFRGAVARMDGNVRIITRATLGAVGVVDSPAYPKSEVEARMAALAKPAPRRRRFWT